MVVVSDPSDFLKSQGQPTTFWTYPKPVKAIHPADTLEVGVDWGLKLREIKGGFVGKGWWKL